jgi:O-antigen/teichoic acid export membrane protein
LTTLAARLALTVALVLHHPGPSSIAIAFLSLTLVECLAMTAIVRSKYPDLKLRLSMFNWTTVRRIAALSTWAFLIGIGWQLSFSIDALVIGSFIGEGAVTTFGVANALIIYLMNFVLGIAAVALPLASSLHARQDNDELCNVYLKWTKITVLLTWIGCGLLAVFGGDFVALWVGPQYGEPAGQVLIVLAASYLFFLPMRGMALPLLVAMGKAGWATWTVLAAGLLNLLLSMVLVVPMGLVGVAVGTAIPNILMAGALLILVCRELGIATMRAVAEVFARAVPGFVVVVALMVAMRMAIQPSSYSELLFVVILSMLAYGTVWVFYVLKGDPHLDSFETWERYAVPMLRRKRANSVEP